MFNKILALAIRGGVTFGLGFIVGATLNDGFNIRSNIPILVASIIWLFGGIYSLSNFNNPYNFRAVKNAENKVTELLDNKNKQKIEEEMLRIKQLLDKDILTKDEYNQKMKLLKDKYL